MRDWGILYRKLGWPLSVAYGNFINRDVYACRRYLEKTQWLKRKDLEKLRLKKLRALIKHAYDDVPHYHEAFREGGVKPADVKSFRDLERLPVLRKSMIRKNIDRMIARNVSQDDMVLRYTTGTTASPMRLYRGKFDVSWGLGAELRGYSWAGYEVGDKLGLIWNYHIERFNSFWFSLERLFGRYRVLHVRELSERSMGLFADKLLAFRPDFIRGHAGSTNIFATFLLKNGIDRIRPRAVLTSCETLWPRYRRTIEKVFGCRVYNYYGSCEMSHIAAECGHHEGLHVFDENVGLEVVDDEGQVADGEDGRLLLTNLHNYAMPFIRYEIGDSGRVLGDECSCGRGLTLFSLQGRTNEHFVCSDGSFTLLCDLQRVFDELPIQDFQVVQEDLDNLVARIAPMPSYTEKHTSFILKHITLVGKAKVRVELVDKILPGKTGKVSHLVSKIATDYT